MDTHALIARLHPAPAALHALLADVTQLDARWKPPGGAWSILEIVCHLVDEEVEDFRRRLDLTLRDPAQPWPPIDPEGAARERRYNEQDLPERLHRFAAEREQSLAWLRTLEDPDWDRTYQHPKAGPIRAGDLLVSWVAHDQLHLRQIAKRLFELTARDGEPFSTAYAGDW